MISAVKHLLVALAILAVGTSQMLGIARGYVCLCSAEHLVVDAPDCASAGCHDHDSQDERHDHDTPGAPHEHRQLKQPLLGHSFAPLVVTLPPAIECAVLPGVNWVLPPATESNEPRPAARVPSGCGPPASELVADTMVMLV